MIKGFRSGRVDPVLTQKMATKDKEWFPGGRSWSKPKKSYPMKGFIHLVKSDSWRDWSANPNMATKEFSPCFVFPIDTNNIFHSSTVILTYLQNAVNMLRTSSSVANATTKHGLSLYQHCYSLRCAKIKQQSPYQHYNTPRYAANKILQTSTAIFPDRPQGNNALHNSTVILPFT